MRVALGIAYRGAAYRGWQSQPAPHTTRRSGQTARRDSDLPSASQTWAI